MKRLLLFLLLVAPMAMFGDEVTFTFVNLSSATFSASAAGLAFDHAINVLVTDNTTGKNIMLLATDSGFTGSATHFDPGPPLVADYLGSGSGSVLIMTGSTTYLTGRMEDSGRLEAEYPSRAGAFLSRFLVDAVDPAILTALGTSTHFAPEGSVSLTIAETSFDGTTLHGTLGGGQVTIETVSVVPEPAGLALAGVGLLGTLAVMRRKTV